MHFLCRFISNETNRHMPCCCCCCLFSLNIFTNLSNISNCEHSRSWHSQCQQNITNTHFKYLIDWKTEIYAFFARIIGMTSSWSHLLDKSFFVQHGVEYQNVLWVFEYFVQLFFIQMCFMCLDVANKFIFCEWSFIH